MLSRRLVVIRFEFPSIYFNLIYYLARFLSVTFVGRACQKDPVHWLTIEAE